MPFFYKQPLEVFVKKKVFLKISQKSLENKDQQLNLKRDSDTGAFLRILRNI